MRSVIDVHTNGFLAIAENLDEVMFYSSNKLRNNEKKLPGPISKIGSYKAPFPVTKVMFNKENPNYLAVIGIKNVQVVTLGKLCDVKSTLTVDLMLEAFGADITLVNVCWVPGFQTKIAVATSSFIKVYDLMKDNISPSHNLELLEDTCKDFCFASIKQSENKDVVPIRMLIGTNGGRVFT